MRVFLAVVLLLMNSAGFAKKNSSSGYEVDVIQINMNDPNRDVRVNCAQALGLSGNNDAIPILKKMLMDKSDFVRIEVVLALRQLGDKSGVAELRRIVATVPKLSDNPKPIERMKAIAQGSTRVKAAKALAAIKDRESVPLLKRLLDDDDGRVVDACKVALAILGDETSKKEFVSAVESTKPEVRAKACEALGEMGGISAVESLRKKLSDWNRDVKVQAVLALGKIRDIDSVQNIKTVLVDEDPIVRENAAASIGMIGSGDGIAPLKMLLTDPNGIVRIAAAKALCLLGDESGKEFLLSSVNSEDKDAKIKALDALSEVAKPEDVEKLEQLLENSDIVVAVKAAKVIMAAKAKNR